MRLVLHVGMAKTGTSALQQTLLTHRRELERNGVLYPRPSRRARPMFRQINHNLLVCLVRPEASMPREFTSDGTSGAALKRMAARFWADLERQVRGSDAQTTVLSGEYVFALPREELVQLRHVLGAVFEPIDVVAYVREPTSYYLSLTQQRVRASHAVTSPAQFRYPVRPALRRHAGVFEGRVHVRPFEQRALDGGSVVRDFLARFVPGGELVAEASTADIAANTSMSGEAMCVMQSLRRHGWPDENDRFNPETARVMEALASVRGASPQRAAQLRPEIARALRSRFAEDLDWLAERWGLTFSDVPHGCAEPTEPAGWTSSELRDVLEVDPADVEATAYVALKHLATRRGERTLQAMAHRVASGWHARATAARATGTRLV